MSRDILLLILSKIKKIRTAMGTIGGTVAVDSGITGVTIKKSGNVVTVMANNIAITTDGITLPDGVRPSGNVYISGHAQVDGTDSWSHGFKLDASGLLKARNDANNNSIAVVNADFTATYVIGG